MLPRRRSTPTRAQAKSRTRSITEALEAPHLPAPAQRARVTRPAVVTPDFNLVQHDETRDNTRRNCLPCVNGL